jgi:hypothetical protein
LIGDTDTVPCVLGAGDIAMGYTYIGITIILKPVPYHRLFANFVRRGFVYWQHMSIHPRVTRCVREKIAYNAAQCIFWEIFFIENCFCGNE